MEIIIVSVLLLYIFSNNKTINKEKFYADNVKYFDKIREKDYDFLVNAKYGPEKDEDQLYMQRITNAVFVFFLLLALSIVGSNAVGSIIDSQFFLNIITSLTIALIVYKYPYNSLRRYYKRNLKEIDAALPAYYKNLDILLLNYTVPQAIEKSIETSPEIIKRGIKRLSERINSGDSSIAPYEEFANDYPVKNTMRIMRMLYRINLNSNEKDNFHLKQFRELVSKLQIEAREKKYNARLQHLKENSITMITITISILIITIIMATLIIISL